MKAYYNLVDDCAEYPEWQRKVEEDIGQNVAMMVIAFDESVRDELVAKSDIFLRFVSIISCNTVNNVCNYRIKKNKSSSSEKQEIIMMIVFILLV